MLALNTLLTLLTLLATTAFALKPPQYTGFRGRWSDHFDAAANTLPVSSKWNVITTTTPFNNEWQAYTNSPSNIGHVGDGRLRITPRSGVSGTPRGWTSGRIESKWTFLPVPGKITRIESQLRIAGAPRSQKQGMWPAFWLMGQSYRDQGVLWPASGELDIFENVNGDGICHGVIHCDVYPGGVCNEPIGLPGTISIPTNSWHTWRLEFDLRNSAWRSQTITWFRDGTRFHQVTGAQINNERVWKTLANQRLYIIFNLAVGGDFPGPPNSNTVGGQGNAFEVGYVAMYEST